MAAFLDREGLGLARALVAVRLGDPDPFALRNALGAAGALGPSLPANPGQPLTADAADAVLLGAAVARNQPELALAGLFAGRPPGPATRAVPLDDPRFGFLRFPRAEPPPVPAISDVQHWSVAAIGEVPNATVRVAVEVPGGVALGSDYGLTIWRNGRFTPFPWPAGCRREARRVEALAVEAGALWVATSQALVRWDFRSPPSVRKHGPDGEEGWDDLRCMLATPAGLVRGYRTATVGAVGPPDTFALAEAPGGVIFAGTAGGELHVLGQPGPVRGFSDRAHQPVRHLAFADGILHVAAGGAHHRFDGAAWSRAEPEPTAFAVDRFGRLWCLAEGKLFRWSRDGAVAVPVSLERPWCLCAAGDRLWVGGRERIWSLTIRG